VTAAMGRRREALEIERVWLRERKATATVYSDKSFSEVVKATTVIKI
jgi:hypothetical protein